MIKTYKANTNVSINVVLESKKNLHVTFVPLSDGSSRFTTDNEDVQRGIESHYKFGRLFRLLKTEDIVVKKKKIVRVVSNAKEKKDVPVTAESETERTEEYTDEIQENAPSTDETTEEVEIVDEVVEEEAEQGARVIKVSDLAAAKDYLADTFGISRTTLRSKKAIVESGEANGIVFDGLD